MSQAVTSDAGMMKYLFDDRQNVTNYLFNIQNSILS